MKRQPCVRVHYEQVNITSNLRRVVAANSGSEPTMCGCPALRMFAIALRRLYAGLALLGVATVMLAAGNR